MKLISNMRLITKLFVGCFLVACLLGTVWLLGNVWAVNSARPSKNNENKQSNPVLARAFVHGAPSSGIAGVVTFRQPQCPGCPTPGPTAPPTDPGFRNFPEPTVEIVARINGPNGVLTPGAHGMHIHEVGRCELPGFTTAGGHFDPGPFGSSTPWTLTTLTIRVTSPISLLMQPDTDFSNIRRAGSHSHPVLSVCLIWTAARSSSIWIQIEVSPALPVHPVVRGSRAVSSS